MPMITYTPADIQAQVHLPYIYGRNAEIIEWFYDNIDGKSAWGYFGIVNDLQIFLFGDKDDAVKFTIKYGGILVQ